MITTILLTIFSLFLDACFAILTPVLNSVINIFPQVKAALIYFNPMWRMFNAYLPVDTLIIIMIAILNIEMVLLTINVIDWIYNKIRGSG